MLRYNLFFKYQIDKIIVVRRYCNRGSLMSTSYYSDSKLIATSIHYDKERIILNIVVQQ